MLTVYIETLLLYHDLFHDLKRRYWFIILLVFTKHLSAILRSSLRKQKSLNSLKVGHSKVYKSFNKQQKQQMKVKKCKFIKVKPHNN